MDNKITVVEQKTIDFYDDNLIAVRAEDGQVYVSLRHMCEAIGIARQSQARRIRDNHVLSKGYTGGTIMVPPGLRGGGGRQQAGLLRVDLVPLWLSGIDVKRVRDDVRPKLEKYQEEVAKVLWEAFQSGRLSTGPSVDELLEKDSPAVRAYKVARAIADLALNQVVLESRLDDYESRLSVIEATLGDSERHISAEQAMNISQAVKAIALELGSRSRRNEFQGVYNELYRRYKIPVYRELPASKFEEAMNFLRDWYSSLVDTEPPF